MNVLIVPSWYPTTAHPFAGSFVRQFVRALVDAGNQVAVVYADDVDCAESVSVEDGALVVRLDAGYRRTASALGKITGVAAPLFLANALAEQADEVLSAEGFSPEVVHVHALWPAGALGAALADRYGVPLVVTEHSEEYVACTDRALTKTPGMVRFVLRPLAARADAYTTPSTMLAGNLARLGLRTGAQVIPNVVPDRHPHPRPVRNAEHPARLLSVSGLGRAKNLPLLLAAIAELVSQRQDFVLDIGGDGPGRASLEHLVAHLNVGPYVNFLGALDADQVNRALDACTAAVISSDYETFSVFGTEALMAGRPVVSTRCGGPEEYVSDQVGVLVEPGNVAELAHALDYMLDRAHEYDPAVVSAYAASRFAPPAVIAAFTDLYQETIRAPR